MPQEITVISKMGVNCYLIKSDSGFVLIDSGYSFSRRSIEKELEAADCRPGNLNLIVITHADFDHTGNCGYLRKKYGCKIAMHRNEAGTAETGHMLANRAGRQGLFTRTVMSLFRLLNRRHAFKPDLLLEDGDHLTVYGCNARAYLVPGHSLGSMGIVTAGNDLFCGDLFGNYGKPAPFNVNEPEEVKRSFNRLRSMGIKTVYPGHGKPFPMEQLRV